MLHAKVGVTGDSQTSKQYAPMDFGIFKDTAKAICLSEIPDFLHVLMGNCAITCVLNYTV